MFITHFCLHYIKGGEAGRVGGGGGGGGVGFTRFSWGGILHKKTRP